MSTIDRSLEQRLADLFADEAPARAPERLADAVLAATTPHRPRPRWLTLARETPMRVDHRPAFGSPPMRTASILLVTLLVALLAVGTVVAGASLLPRPTSLIPPDRGVFTPTGSMAVERTGATATTLLDGRVLVLGGTADTTAELWDPVTGTFAPVGPMADRARDFQTATLLPDGRVLIVGGRNPGHVQSRASAEMFDPATMKFTLVSPPAVDRYGGRAMLLADGRVLIMGSFGDAMRDPEVYDPIADTWSPGGSLPEASYPPGTLLPDGRVLVIDETDGSATIWDPGTGASVPAGGMAVPRGGFTATLLADGRVLVTGGNRVGPGQCNPGVLPRPHGSCAGGSVDTGSFLATAEIWDPSTMTFDPTGSMTQPRFQHAAALLADGRVLIVASNGWSAPSDSGGASAEVFRLR